MQTTIPVQLTIHNNNERKVTEDVEKPWGLFFKKGSVLKMDTNQPNINLGEGEEKAWSGEN